MENVPVAMKFQCFFWWSILNRLGLFFATSFASVRTWGISTWLVTSNLNNFQMGQNKMLSFPTCLDPWVNWFNRNMGLNNINLCFERQDNFRPNFSTHWNVTDSKKITITLPTLKRWNLASYDIVVDWYSLASHLVPFVGGASNLSKGL